MGYPPDSKEKVNGWWQFSQAQYTVSLLSRVPYYFYFHISEPFPKASFGDLEFERGEGLPILGSENLYQNVGDPWK